jgi:hypothetical protein
MAAARWSVYPVPTPVAAGRFVGDAVPTGHAVTEGTLSTGLMT